MIADSLKKFKLGFFFIMIGFRIQGFDIFPDIIGYIFFAVAFYHLRDSSCHFVKAFKYNIPLIFISLFSIYQEPAQQEGIRISPWGWLGIIISVISFVLNLMTIYNLFMGIKELEENFDAFDLADESQIRWRHYSTLQIAMLLSFLLILIPVIAFLYIIVVLIVAIWVLIGIINYLQRCIDSIVLEP